eukprot:344334-Alexandrium_andersonii.AAC.1
MDAVHSRTTRQWAKPWPRTWCWTRTPTGTWCTRPFSPRGSRTSGRSPTPTARSWASGQQASTRGTRPRWWLVS